MTVSDYCLFELESLCRMIEKEAFELDGSGDSLSELDFKESCKLSFLAGALRNVQSSFKSFEASF